MNKTISFALKVHEPILNKLKGFCDGHGIKLGFFVEKAIVEKIEREEMLDDTRDIINLRHEESSAVKIGDYFAKRSV